MKLWNFADVWGTVAATVPERTAQVHGDERVSWAELEARAEGIARTLLDAGLRRQSHVALLLYNSPVYMECAFGILKAGLVPVNTNYRYRSQELEYLWTNADAAAVVFSGALTETVADVRPRLPQVTLWLHLDDGSHPRPEWAHDYAAAIRAAPISAAVPEARTGDDLMLIYTGGTTGLPKGVMWRQHDLYRASDTARDPEEADLEHVRRRIRERRPEPPVGLSASPLMHGTGFVFAGTVFSRAGTLVTTTSRSFDVVELLDTIQRERVTALCIVGDAFCLPIVDALDAEPDRWDISSLAAVSSGGMVWSPTNKQRLLRYAPEAILVDTLNSSEASGMGRAIASSRKPPAAARFRLGKNAFVLDDQNREVEPGSGEIGRVAVRGNIPLGYYKDPVRTQQTFLEINGVRCTVPGDYATVEADGTITLLGRGSTSINTAGEKVYPEEVEYALKRHPAVADAIVVGVPSERFGEVVAAVVQPRPSASVDAAALIAHTKTLLASYKAPRHVMFVESLDRGPSGKADYTTLRNRIVQWLGQPSPIGGRSHG